jgi:hypothetical protein
MSEGMMNLKLFGLEVGCDVATVWLWRIKCIVETTVQGAAREEAEECM